MIDPDELDLCMMVLTEGAPYNWTPESVSLYRNMLKTLDDASCLAEACGVVIRSWTRQDRPPVALVLEAYKAESRRREMSQGELPPAEERYPTYEEGVEIARQAYHAECYRQGRAPNEELFLAFLGAGREDRRAKENWGQPGRQRGRN